MFSRIRYNRRAKIQRFAVRVTPGHVVDVTRAKPAQMNPLWTAAAIAPAGAAISCKLSLSTSLSDAAHGLRLHVHVR